MAHTTLQNNAHWCSIMATNGSAPPVRCVRCGLIHAMLDALCESCYRSVHIVPRAQERDKLLSTVSNLITSIVAHEARLKAARAERNKVQHRCDRCKAVFEYYGALVTHECAQTLRKPSVSRRILGIY